MADQHGIVILHLIQDITNKQDEKMQIMMSYVKKFLEFAMAYHEPKQLNT